MDFETIMVITVISIMGGTGFFFLGCAFLQITLYDVGAGRSVGIVAGIAGLIFSILCLQVLLRGEKGGEKWQVLPRDFD